MVLPGFTGRPLTKTSLRAHKRIVALTCAFAVLALAGCKKKADVTTGLSELEKAFPAAAATATPAAPIAQPGSAPPPTVDVNAQVNSALVAVRANHYVKGVVALEKITQARGVSVDQLVAVTKAKEAIVNDLVTRAARGDANAKAQLAAIEKTHSQ